MKYSEMKRLAATYLPSESEHDIQCVCVAWFRYRYPQYHKRLFAIPNGGERHIRVAAKMKAEGVLAGVADLQLAVRNRQYGALFIEMKTSKGRQSERQKEWGEEIERGGYRYAVCRSVEEFQREIINYINNI